MLNAARARLQVYDENVFYPEHVMKPQKSELPTVKQESNQVSSVYQHMQTRRDGASEKMHQDDSGELLKILAEAISANSLPIPEPTVFSEDPLKFNH